MSYHGNAPADVALVVGQDVITTTEIQDATIATADIANDAITAIKVDDDGTGFQMGSLGLGGAVSGDEKLTVTGTASFSGAITGNLTGNASGTSATVTGGTQASITSAANLVTVGTIGTGVWNGTAIASAYLDADTAHLSGTQTFSGAKTFSADVTLSGAKLLVAASAQGIFGAADGDTGIRWEGSNVLAIDTNGSERITIDASGNVGVGALINDFLPTLGVQGNQPGLVLNDDETDAFFVAYCDGDASVMMYDHSDDFIIKQAESVGGGSAADVLKLDSSKNATFSGNIAVTKANAKITVTSGTNESASLRLVNDAQDWDLNTQTNDNFAIYSQTGSAAALSITPALNATFAAEVLAGNHITAAKAGGNDRGQSRLSVGNGWAMVELGEAGGAYWGIGPHSPGSYGITSECQFAYMDGSSWTAGIFKVATGGNITGTHGSYHTSSDETLKKNISTISSGLDKVNAMRGVQFKWKKEHDPFPEEEHPNHQMVNLGFIAQELEDIVPEVVNTNSDTGLKAVLDANQLTAVLVEAIKELSAKVEALENA